MRYQSHDKSPQAQPATAHGGSGYIQRTARAVRPYIYMRWGWRMGAVTRPWSASCNSIEHNTALLFSYLLTQSDTGITLEKSINQFSGKNFSEFKENLSQVLVDKITPISVEIKKLLDEKNYIDKILSEGCKKAEDVASKKLKKIHEIVGF